MRCHYCNAAAIAASQYRPIHSMSSTQVQDPLTVVIIDDNRDGADTLALLFKVMGHSARVAYDPRTGIKLAQELEPDLVFFDLDMPDLDGCDALSELRGIAPHLKALFVCLTGQSSHDAKQRCMTAGFHRFITKPLSSVELEAIIDLARRHRDRPS
jgi:CheY-like chemotaxis protein